MRATGRSSGGRSPRAAGRNGRRPLAPIEHEPRGGQPAGGADVVEVQVGQHDRLDRGRLDAALARLRDRVLSVGDAQHAQPPEQPFEPPVETGVDQQRPRAGVLDQEGGDRAPAPAPARHPKAERAQPAQRPRWPPEEAGRRRELAGQERMHAHRRARPAAGQRQAGRLGRRAHPRCSRPADPSERMIRHDAAGLSVVEPDDAAVDSAPVADRSGGGLDHHRA